jgi:hypothetical protein
MPQPDALHSLECNFILCPVLQLRGSRRLMSRHLLGVLEPAVVLQVNRDAGRR